MIVNLNWGKDDFTRLDDVKSILCRTGNDGIIEFTSADNFFLCPDFSYLFTYNETDRLTASGHSIRSIEILS